MIYREMLHPVGGLLSEQKDVKMFPPVPMVYEQVPVEPLNWEYRVLSIDLREQDVPTVEELNELGSQGWLLVGVLPTRKSAVPDNWPLVMSEDQFGEKRREERGILHYYFVRQKQA
jgi:hypothetical protein